MDIPNIIGLLVSLSAFTFSSVKYQKLNNNFDKDRQKIKSEKIFGLAYRYLQVSTLLFVVLSFTVKPGWLLIFHETSSLIYSGLVIVIIGLFVFQSAITALGEEYSPCFDLRQPADFVNTGIYQHIRHPIYTSNLTLLFGAFVSTGSLFVLLNFLILLFFYYRSANKEEVDLLTRFSDYKDYQKKTGMFLFNITSASK